MSSLDDASHDLTQKGRERLKSRVNEISFALNYRKGPRAASSLPSVFLLSYYTDDVMELDMTQSFAFGLTFCSIFLYLSFQKQGNIEFLSTQETVRLSCNSLFV